MKKHRVKISFKYLSDDEFISRTEDVLVSMAKNEHFLDPVPSLETVGSVLDEFIDAVNKCVEGKKKDIVYKNKMRRALNTILSNLGKYVNLVSEGDVIKLDSSGFELINRQGSSEILPPPESIHVTSGSKPGELYIRFSHVKEAACYVVLYSEVPTPENNDEWQTQIFHDVEGKITGLKRGIKYVLKAASMSLEANTYKHYNYSDSIEIYTD